MPGRWPAAPATAFGGLDHDGPGEKVALGLHWLLRIIMFGYGTIACDNHFCP
jgi:hypothetical protein